MKKGVLDSNLLIIFSVTLMAVLGVSSITPAFPSMAEALGISRGMIGMLITAFTVPGVVLTPIAGVLADRWGRKRVLVPSLLLFATAGTLCAFVRDFHLLLGLRFLQGIGAAPLGSINITILGDLYHGVRRAKAMGYNASVLSLGTTTYPLVGGLLATLGWFYPFLLSFLALPVGLAVLLGLKNPEPRATESVLRYLSGALKILKNPGLIGVFIVGTCTFIVLYGSYLTYLPILMARNFGASPFMIGIVMSASSLTSATASSQLGRMAARVPGRSMVFIAFVLYVLSMVLMPLMPGGWLLLFPAMLFGFANGINMPTLNTILAGLAPMRYRAAIMSLNGMIIRIGQSTGPLITGIFLALWGTPACFYAGAGIAALGLPVILTTFKSTPGN